jgi:hypothetical protein
MNGRPCATATFSASLEIKYENDYFLATVKAGTSIHALTLLFYLSPPMNKHVYASFKP